MSSQIPPHLVLVALRAFQYHVCSATTREPCYCRAGYGTVGIGTGEMRSVDQTGCPELRAAVTMIETAIEQGHISPKALVVESAVQLTLVEAKLSKALGVPQSRVADEALRLLRTHQLGQFAFDGLVADWLYWRAVQ